MLLKTICILLITIFYMVNANTSRTIELSNYQATLNEIKQDINRLSERLNKLVLEQSLGNSAIVTEDSNSDATTKGDDWIVILNRMDGSENFYRNWNDYRNGFGNLSGEFFLGLNKIHALTTQKSQELLIILEDYSGTVVNETYDRFAIEGEDKQFALSVLGEAKGEAGDSLRYHLGMKFTTYDRDNDEYPKGNCARERPGGWWFKWCTVGNLAGTYNSKTCNIGVTWDSFRGTCYSLKRAVMLIRPRQ